MRTVMASATLVLLSAFLVASCGDDDDEDEGQDAGIKPGVCDLSKCPAPDAGIACCTPNGDCGYDPTGLGIGCVPTSPTGVCDISECDQPLIGVPCCTPNAQCGVDLFATGLLCFPAPPITAFAIPPQPPECGLEDCPVPAVGRACCAGEGICGSDPFGIGLCGPNLIFPDAGSVPLFPPLPEGGLQVSYEPPDDPSLTGECPSFLGLFGPVWGCCSSIGVCGTFQYDACLIPIGTPLPVGSGMDSDMDGGTPDFGSCTPPD